jgi:hypothetical protein
MKTKLLNTVFVSFFFSLFFLLFFFFFSFSLSNKLYTKKKRQCTTTMRKKNKKKKRNNCTIHTHVYTSNGSRKKNAKISSFLFSLSCTSFSLWCQNVYNEETDHTRATTVCNRDNQVMKEREEREKESGKKCVLHTQKHIHVYMMEVIRPFSSCSF